MSPLFVMLILAYGPLNWSFPWWLWTLVILGGGVTFYREDKKE